MRWHHQAEQKNTATSSKLKWLNEWIQLGQIEGNWIQLEWSAWRKRERKEERKTNKVSCLQRKANWSWQKALIQRAGVGRNALTLLSQQTEERRSLPSPPWSGTRPQPATDDEAPAHNTTKHAQQRHIICWRSREVGGGGGANLSRGCSSFSWTAAFTAATCPKYMRIRPPTQQKAPRHASKVLNKTLYLPGSP